MKRLLELTASDYDAKEYVDVDSITNIIPLHKNVGGFWATKREVIGSIVYSGGMDSGTLVKETTAQIIEMIKNKQFALEY